MVTLAPYKLVQTFSTIYFERRQDGVLDMYMFKGHKSQTFSDDLIILQSQIIDRYPIWIFG